jgi:hypothetical protein
VSKSLDKILKSIERSDHALKKLQKMMDADRQMVVNNLLGVDMNCPKCGAFIDERDGSCLACDFFDRLAAQDKIRG